MDSEVISGNPIVPSATRTRKVALVGTSSTAVAAPFDDPSWEIWTMTDRSIPRWDVFFELHDRAVLDRDRVYADLLINDGTRKIYTRPEFVDVIPGAVALPFEELTARYGSWFFTSTVAWAMALAVEQGDIDELGLWGIDMAAETEYASQKPGCRFFIQLARLSGMKIKAPSMCEIIVPGIRYGIDADPPLRMKLTAREQELSVRRAQCQQMMRNTADQVLMLQGRMRLTDAPEECQAKLDALAPQYADLERQDLRLEGALQDLTHMQHNWLG